MVQSDSSRIVEETDDEFGDRLQAAIDDAREEIEKETEQYRQDLEKAYRAKVSCTCTCSSMRGCLHINLGLAVFNKISFC